MAERTIQNSLSLGLQHHRAGRLAEAEGVYRQILSLEPANADALRLLGLIAYQLKQFDAAVNLIRRAIAVKPELPEAHNDLGLALEGSGQVDEGIAAYRRAIALKPNYAEAHSNLGNALRGQAKLNEAIAAYREAIAINPNLAEAHSNLGNALRDQGQIKSSIAAYQRAIAINPKLAEAHSNLGNALALSGKMDDAIATLRQAIELNPNLAKAHNSLGLALAEKQRFAEAEVAYRRAIAIDPRLCEAHNNLGMVLAEQRRLDEAVAAYHIAIELNAEIPETYNNLGKALNEQGKTAEATAALRQAISLNPEFAKAHNNLGNALRHEGEIDAAIAVYRRAIAIDSTSAEAHYNLGMALLAQGNFERGWAEYEWRWKCREFPSPARGYAQPLWEGEPLRGRRILLHTEQGFGDAIQFIRYLPRVAERGGRIVLACPRELRRLFGMMGTECEILAGGDPFPAFDVHCPLLSLPRIFETRLENVPAPVPYLHAAEDDAAKWKERFIGEPSNLNVGLSWAGSGAHRNDRNRSMTLPHFAPLTRIPGVRLISLQKSKAVATDRAPLNFNIVDWTADLNDFADTAGLIANLDLIITVDTAVAHLAGAMGKPVWTLLPFAADWRWMADRTDSPWYPTIRLFRQKRRGDWEGVIAGVAAALKEFRAG